MWVKWNPPGEDWWKLNSNGAYAGNPGPMAAAALGIKLAKDLLCNKIVVESDSLIAVKLLTDDNVSFSHSLGVLINFCKSTLRDFTAVKIQHTLKEGNYCKTPPRAPLI
ncbi:putative ribonuclease H-like domain-containing protein [Senna tora]|uniref:Putative ribonuclease H-like domain-containing protein n=1 Tax=Senna tora TaxID=362788 RepID=A0A835CHD7_9FABA|nr:putative ribonuclease H-like domain-containing protein [Senna tora]